MRTDRILVPSLLARPRPARALSALPLAALLAACGPTPVPAPADSGVSVAADPDAGAPDDAGLPDAGTPPPEWPLEIRFLGTQGFLVRHGPDAVLTAPFFTRASVVEVTTADVASDAAAVDQGLTGVDLTGVSAVVSGHAHYDHLMDVPRTLDWAPGARLYANRSAAHLLAGLAPDRPAKCTSPPAATPLPRSRVFAADAPGQSVVDYRLCPGQRPAGAPLEGAWIDVPGGHVRLRALCSSHPEQFLFLHFGLGAVEEDQCELPTKADAWREGNTLAWLIDFLSDDGRVTYRVYYQDAPTDAPVGHVPAEVLAEKPVDVALLCVGNYEQVTAQPEDVIAALQPRFAVSGHWDDFFEPPKTPTATIPFLNLNAYVQRADAALPPPSDAPVLVGGLPRSVRHVLAMPGQALVFAPAETN